MQQVKIFKSIEDDSSKLEDEVNAWIRQAGVKVVQITGNIAPQSGRRDSGTGGLGKSAFSPSDVLLVVLYETP